MNRRLAVPFAVKGLHVREGCEITRIRKLKDFEICEDELDTLKKIAENRARIERLWNDIRKEPEMEDSSELETELDYINASIELGLLEIRGELEDVPYSDELFEEAIA